MSYQYVDPYGNPYVRGWGNDFTEEERRELEIGEFNWNSPYYKGPERGPGKIPIDTRINDLFSRLPTSTGWPEGGRTIIKDPRTPYYDDNWNAGGSGRTTPEDRMIADVQPDPTFTGEDWLNQQLPSGGSGTPPMQTPPADVPSTPVEVERYPSGIRKDDPRYDRETGKFNMVYIPKFDDPNYQEGVRPRDTPESVWNWMQRQKSGGEGVQYRR